MWKRMMNAYRNSRQTAASIENDKNKLILTESITGFATLPLV